MSIDVARNVIDELNRRIGDRVLAIVDAGVSLCDITQRVDGSKTTLFVGGRADSVFEVTVDQRSVTVSGYLAEGTT